MGATAALHDVFARLAAGLIDLPSVAEPTPDVPGLEAFFGCQFWSPAREYRTVPLEWCCLLETREVCIVDVCAVCYSDYTGIAIPPNMVCMGVCGRSRLDDRIEAILRDHPPPRVGEPGPLEIAERDAARAKRRKAAETAAREKSKARAGTDAYLYRSPSRRNPVPRPGR